MKSILVYDIHELETETSDSSGLRKVLGKIVEFLLIRLTEVQIVVSEPIKEWYENKYSLNNVYVIKNMPSQEDKKMQIKQTMREHWDIPEEHIIFSYHGALIKDRGIELLLESFSEIVDKERHLVVIGFGDLSSLVKRYSDQFSNIHYHQAMEKGELMTFLEDVDVGLNFIENNCLNHEFCLPNKVWEYLDLSIPILVNDLVGMRSIIQEYNCGWLVREDKEEFKENIINLTKEEITLKGDNAKLSKDQWGWEFEERKLVEIYKKLEAKIES